MDIVELDPVEVDVGPAEGDGLVVQEGAHDGGDLAHDGQRVITDDPDLAGQRVPPRAQPADDPTRGEVVEGGEGRGQDGRVARPDAGDTGADLHPLGAGA